MRTSTALKVFGVVAALILGVFSAPAANADTRQYFKTTSGRFCLFGGNLSSATGLVATRACAASNNMVWTWNGNVGKGHWHRITGAAQGSCLDSDASGSVYVHRCLSNSNNQFWQVYKNDERGWLMIENLQTKLCLTHLSDGGGVSARGCRTGDSTQWWGVANRP